MQPPIFGSNKTEPPKTTPFEVLRYRIPIIWEYTQAVIACAIVACNVIVGVHIGLFTGKAELPATLSDALLVVLGFYFGRANPALIHKGK
jgi:hypothetical protein